MKLNSIIKIRLNSNDINKIIRILHLKNISIKNVKYYDKYITFDINLKDYKKIKSLFKKDDYKIIKYYGLNGIINNIKINYIFYISLIVGILLVFVLSNMIFYVEIKTDDQNIKSILENELNKYGIKKYKFRKSSKEFDNIKNKILEDNKDTLEWLSFERNGTKYIINITKRVIKSPVEKGSPSNIVASKDAMIKHIESSSGVILKDVDEYVKKGDIIITGNIIKSDKYLKGQVRSEGKVYGEVWYSVIVSVPFRYREYLKTGLSYNEYYINVFSKKISLINKYNLKNIMYEDSLYLEKPYLPFKIYKRSVTEYYYKEINLSKKQAYNLALSKADNKINSRLKTNEYVIDKKVLKKDLTSSKIILRVFYKVYELISKEEKLEHIDIDTDISKGDD